MNERVPIHVLPEDGCPRFFAAANTANGFYNGFDALLAHYAPRRLFILKGGPGVGKSTLMKRAASLARERGIAVHLYHCSSDPSSLDAVFLPEKGIGVLDGTPPHAVEPRLAGCADELVDLGEAWDKDALRKERSRIGCLCAAKNDAYRSAYRLLAAAKALTDEAKTLCFRCVDREKMNAAAARLLAGFGSVKGQSAAVLPERLFASAFGTGGAVRTLSPERMAKTRLLVTDVHGTARLFYEVFEANALKKGLRVSRFCDPLEPSVCAGLYLPDAAISVTDGGEWHDGREAQARIVNMSRFFDAARYKEHRTLCRFCEKSAGELIAAALAALRTAGNAHAELERIYGAATDYAAVRRIGEKRVLSVIAEA